MQRWTVRRDVNAWFENKVLVLTCEGTKVVNNHWRVCRRVANHFLKSNFFTLFNCFRGN